MYLFLGGYIWGIPTSYLKYTYFSYHQIQGILTLYLKHLLQPAASGESVYTPLYPKYGLCILGTDIIQECNTRYFFGREKWNTTFLWDRCSHNIQTTTAMHTCTLWSQKYMLSESQEISREKKVLTFEGRNLASPYPVCCNYQFCAEKLESLAHHLPAIIRTWGLLMNRLALDGQLCVPPEWTFTMQ